MSTFIRPLNEEDNRQPTYGTLSIEERNRGIKAIEQSIAYTKMLSQKQKELGIYGTNALRKVEAIINENNNK